MTEKTKQETSLPAADLFVDDDMIMKSPQHSDSRLPRLQEYKERLAELRRQNHNES